MKFTDQDLIERVPKHDLRAVARLISLVENNSPRAHNIQSALYRHTGNAFVVGITGSPGAGKSTLVDQLARDWRKRGKKVAIIAIDPTSPFSGGAILGDRIRMSKSVEDESIYMRSMATRGALGGISRATFDAIWVLDAAGFDLILVETVGVGQAEVDIVRTADTCVVVLVPGMGDSVQSIKAGILEIADLFVINKADRDGADALQRDIRLLLSLGDYKERDWKPELLRTVATTGEGTAEVSEGIENHAKWLRASDAGKNRRLMIIRENIVKLATELTLDQILNQNSEMLDSLAVDCLNKRTTPYEAVKKLLA